jgi:iron complex outermembrane receptor protein
VACLATFGSMSISAASAQQNDSATPILERITITGSNIRRTDYETVAPVEIITREEIERSGYQTVAEVLQKNPVTGSGAFSDCPCTTASGSTSVSLRSLGQGATLVLVNGRRITNYGFAQNIQDTFVDLSAIPVSVVERIEILKDGASAIYGSDAIAGVINVILRSDFKGIETSANVGFFEGKNDYRASVSLGAGDLRTDRFNVFGALDYFHRDGLTMSETEFGRTSDFRGQQGGRNFQNLVLGGTWSAPLSASATLFRANAECRSVVDYAGGVALGLVQTNQLNRPLGSGINQPGNTFCVRDFADVFTVDPETDRVSFLGRATVEVARDVLGYAELGLVRNQSKFIYTEPSFANGTRFYPVPPPALLAASPFNAIFAPGSAGNPLSVNARYFGVLNDLGARHSDITSDAFRILAGLKFSSGGWNYDSAVGYSMSDVAQKINVLLTQGTVAALGMPDTLQPPTPITSNSLYNLDRPSLNSPALRASMFGTDDRTSKSELKMIDARATTEVGSLPGGPIGVALGIEYRNESMRGVPSELLLSGGILNEAATLVDGSRTNLAMFSELALPLTRQLEGQAALRYDHYSDAGSAVTPKLGLKFKATRELLLRANWARGFRAPSLPASTKSAAFLSALIVDPTTGGLSQVAASINGNPGLKPEKSRSFTAGLVFEPSASFSAGVDFYDITWSNQVAVEDFQTIADNPDDPRVLRNPATGAVLSIAGSYINLGKISTRGVDLNLRYQTGTSYGRLGTRLAATYVDSYQINGEAWAGTNGAWTLSNISAIPRWKGQWTISWEPRPWIVQATVNYLHHYWRTYGLENFPAYFDPALVTPQFPQTGQLNPRSPSYTTLDLYVRYNVTPKLAVSGSVVNLTDRLPPFDPSFSTVFFHDRQLGYDIRGRTFRLGMQYTF